ARSRIDSGRSGWCALDFSGIRLATVSWLREGPVNLQRYAATMRPDISLIAVNPSDVVLEELGVTLESTSSIMIVAQLDSELYIQTLTVLGLFERDFLETFNIV